MIKKQIYSIVFLTISLLSIIEATNIYKPFIPIFPQVTNGRYFKASVMTGLSAFLINDILSFENISQDRQFYSNYYTLVWQQNMYEQTGNIYDFDKYVADSTFLEYRKTNITLYNSYLNAAYSNRRVLEAQYQKNIDMIWLSSIYTYSIFDAFDIYYGGPKQNISSTDAMLRSMIFPGWGQIYVGSYSQAGFIYGMMIGFAGHAFYANKLVNYYDNSVLPEFQAEAEKYSTQKTTYLLYILGIYLYNIVDAYVEGELSNFNLDISVYEKQTQTKDIYSNISLNYLF